MDTPYPIGGGALEISPCSGLWARRMRSRYGLFLATVALGQPLLGPSMASSGWRSVGGPSEGPASSTSSQTSIAIIIKVSHQNLPCVPHADKQLQINNLPRRRCF